jgi:hypothetical protein
MAVECWFGLEHDRDVLVFGKIARHTSDVPGAEFALELSG